MWNNRKVSHICCFLLLALLQITIVSSAAGYITQPANVTVAEGATAVFQCGVPAATPDLTFTFYGTQMTYNLTCPNGNVKASPQTLQGRCDMKNGESLATWVLNGAVLSDNGTKVVCQQPNNPVSPAAMLYVSIAGTNYAILIGCTIGGFFGTILVFGLLYIILRRSEAFQECFRGKEEEEEDDINTIVTKG